MQGLPVVTIIQLSVRVIGLARKRIVRYHRWHEYNHRCPRCNHRAAGRCARVARRPTAVGGGAVIDQHIPRHWLHQGLSLGQLVEAWNAYILSQGDHRKVRNIWTLRSLPG